MCDNHHHVLPCHNSFYYRYMQEHAALSYHFQKLHNVHNETPFYGMPCPGYVHNQTTYRSSYSSSSSSCSIRNSSGTSSSSVEDEDEGMDNEEYENNDEDETEYEYELNVEAILAMRAAKEEIKKQELKDEESAESNSKESSELKSESLDSQDETESKSDSIVIVESDNDEFDEFEFIGTCRNILGSKPFRSVCGFNKSEETRNRTKFMEYIYGSESNVVIALETTMNLTFQAYCDDLQPSFWPVLPLRL